MIGDVPYGTDAEAHFPTFIQGINADPDVTQVTHLGDIKSGSTTCTDERFQAVRQNFDLFADPLYYTPGDNEWTDCHRANNGAYQPLERLAKVRSLFFDPTGRTQGHQVPVTTQARRGFPENFRWTRGDVSFATIHVIGSNNDLAPWAGIGQTSATPQQVDEQERRMAAAIDNVKATYADARRHHRRTVVIQQQADMFDPTITDPQLADYSAFTPLVQALVDESRRFHGVDLPVQRRQPPVQRGPPRREGLTLVVLLRREGFLGRPAPDHRRRLRPRRGRLAEGHGAPARSDPADLRAGPGTVATRHHGYPAPATAPGISFSARGQAP